MFEFTVYFPDSDEPEVHNAGLDNQRDLMENVLEDLQDTDCTTRATLIARPTKKLLSDYEGESLMMAFPLQFPFGVGTTDKEGNMRNTIDVYRHLLSLSSPHNHRADFVLVIHNMYERKRMVTNAFLKTCTGNDNLAQEFGSIQEDEISSAADRWTNGASGSGMADLFLKKMEATAQCMSHTNGAAKRARQRMFALTAMFGAPSIFFTISPDDHFNYRIRILAADKRGAKPIPDDGTENLQTLADFDVECGSIRQTYPGLCAFDFEQVLAITIQHLLGWDVNKKCNNDIEGVFGDVDAWSHAVEEQGRKTLHAHFLIWMKNWSKLLKRLYGESTRELAAAELVQYIDKVMHVELTGCKPVAHAVPHACTGVPDIEQCSNQDLRNLRYKKGISAFGDEAIVRCKTCGTSFSSEDIAATTLAETGIAADDEKRKIRMQVKLMRHLSGDDDMGKVATCQVVSELHNLHRSTHTRTCFKKDTCCRMNVPNKECLDTTVTFEENNTPWYTWNGIRGLRNLFVSELKRSHCDAFVNVNNKYVSEVLGSNNNVICGCDGGSCMYITCYTSKNTQKEDSAVHKNVAKYLVKKMRREEELVENAPVAIAADSEEADIAALTRKGLSRLIGAVLLATSAHVVAAPMAAYLVRNDSRFDFSHEFIHCNMSAFRKAGNGSTSLDAVEGSLFVRSSEANYTMRPDILQQHTLHSYLSTYTVSRLKANSFHFTDERHPSKSLHGVTPTQRIKIPLVSHLDFCNASNFEGYNIQTVPFEGEGSPAKHILRTMNEYAAQVLVLFYPFREQSDLQIDGSYLRKFRAVQQEILTCEVLQFLQNVQDCRNALSSGRPQDVLDKCTEGLTFAGTRTNQRAGDDDDDDAGEDGVDDSCYNIMEELMSDAALRPTVLTGLRDSEELLSLSTKHIRRLGSNNSGFKLLRSPIVEEKSVLKRASPHGRTHRKRKRKQTDIERDTALKKQSKKEDLYLLSLETVNRRVDEENFYVEATGTVESIQAYAVKAFGADADQQRAFEVIMSNFVLQFHYESDDIETVTGQSAFTEPDANGHLRHERPKRLALSRQVSALKNISGLAPGSRQLICFLTGAGGSGKSKVLNAVKSYGKAFCENMGAAFTKRTIVVTALTGTAAVTIGGETTHGACSLFKNNDNMANDTVEWADSYLVIIDEVSFASKETIILLNEKLNLLKENKDAKYGGLCVVFAGDFSQLPPVRSASIYSVAELHQWHEWVNVLLQLNGNHRFKNDPEWGEILQFFRRHGPTEEQVEQINKRVVTPVGMDGPSEEDIPANATYAVATNMDRNAVNDGIFSKHLENTHFRDKPTPTENHIPDHTVIIRASDLSWKKSKKSREYVPFNQLGKDIMFSYCGDAHLIETRSSRRVDPLLKLYYDRPMMLNTNRDVKGSEANGTSCRFRGVRLKQGVTKADAQIMRIDGYWVRSYCVSQLESIIVHNEHTKKDTEIEAKSESCLVDFPLLGVLGMTGTSKIRVKQRIKATQFPFNICNATTCHKLQGATKECLVVNSFRYTDNWPYVVLSRVTERKGLFLRTPINGYKVKGMSDGLREFMDHWVNTKMPAPPHEDIYSRQHPLQR